MNKIVCFLVLGFALSASVSVVHASETKKKCKGHSEDAELIKCLKKFDPTGPNPFIIPGGTGGDGTTIIPGQGSTYSQ